MIQRAEILHGVRKKLMNLAEEIKRYTYKDYVKWDTKIRYELINGIPYAMASPSIAHERISRKLFRQLDNFLIGKTCEVFDAPLDVRLNYDSFDDIVVQPDIFVVCDESKLNGKHVKGAPDFIIEILSPSNTLHDTRIKFIQYQKAGVKEYWIVDSLAKTVQVYILKEGKYGKGIVYRDDDIVPVHTLKGCEINLADVFYDTFEPEDDEDDSELIAKQRIIEAFKKVGVNDEQIEKALKELDDYN